MYLDDHPECWLEPEQCERLFGIVASSDIREEPFIRVEVASAWTDFPAEAPADLCYVAAYSSGFEYAALVDYTRPTHDGFIWIRIIDEETRGWRNEELAEELYGEDGEGTSYALLPMLD